MKRCVLDIETEDLDPKAGRIICIGVKDVESGKTTVFYHENEKQMILDFMKYCKSRQYTEVIGYNLSFDMRFLFAKCLRYGISGNGIFRATFTDVMDNVRAVKKMYSYNRPGKLDEWLHFVFGSGKLPLGESVPELYRKGKIGEIIEYNKWDVEQTFRLWKRIRLVLYDEM